METFAIIVKDTNQWLDIPDCHETQVRLQNGDPYPKWMKDEDNVIRYADRPSWCLNVIENILCLSEEPISWKFLGTKLVLGNLQVSAFEDVIFCFEETDNPIELIMLPIDLPRPATSCHLRYGDLKNIDTSWTIQCSIEVEKSYDCTYFMITGFGPGGKFPPIY